MDPRETGALIGLAQRRFQNFSEAADSILETLTDVVPGSSSSVASTTTSRSTT